MSARPLGVAIVGCGNIAGHYARDIARFLETKLVGVTDLLPERAQTFAAEHDTKAYRSLEEALADDAVEIVVNLTTHHAHRAVTAQCLAAGKHVHSEKPLALTVAEAQELVALANEKGVRLGCSPFTLMGEAQQTAWKWIREGRAGTVRVVYAEVNWGRIEAWHPAPEAFYEVGALFDVGVYPLSILTAIFGPARCVRSYGTLLYPDRETLEGRPFHIETPDFVISIIELADGTLVRLTTNFYVPNNRKQSGLEFHGDRGSLYLANWQRFEADVEFAEYGQDYQPVPLVRAAFEGTEWGRGVRDLAEAIRENRPHRATGEQAAHIVEILVAATESMKQGQPVEIHSTFTPPAPMEWAV